MFDWVLNTPLMLLFNPRLEKNFKQLKYQKQKTHVQDTRATRHEIHESLLGIRHLK